MQGPGVTIPLGENRPLRLDAAGLMRAERMCERSVQEIFAMFIEKKVPMYVWVACLTGALSGAIPSITEALTIELVKKHAPGRNFNAQLAWCAEYILRAFQDAFPNDEAPAAAARDALNITAEPGPPQPMTASGIGTPSSGSQ